MKTLSKIVVLIISLSVFTSCSKQSSTFDKSYDEKGEIVVQDDINDQSTIKSEVEKMNLLTKDELIELCDLSEDEYAEKNLDAFISDFNLTKENVSKYNIHALLENYTQLNNVEYLFENKKNRRRDVFTEDIIAIAFKENKNTTVNSVYIDVENNQKWSCEGAYIFFDLNSYESKPFSLEKMNTLIEKFDEVNLFALENKNSSEDIADPMSFSFVIEYSDGTYFSVSRSGMPNEICPEHYAELCEIMFE